MQRILISQSEKNNGTDYLIVNGKMLSDDDSVVKYGRIISETDNWKEIYKDYFLEIRKNGDQLLLKSFYNDKDIVGRHIYYLYLAEESDSLQVILDYLKKDSQLINKTFDRKRTLDIINKIENSKKIKRTILKCLAIAFGLSFLVYLLTKP